MRARSDLRRSRLRLAVARSTSPTGVLNEAQSRKAALGEPSPEDKTHKRGIHPDLVLIASTTPPVVP
jgi:hypothetical protein